MPRVCGDAGVGAEGGEVEGDGEVDGKHFRSLPSVGWTLPPAHWALQTLLLGTPPSAPH